MAALTKIDQVAAMSASMTKQSQQSWKVPAIVDFGGATGEPGWKGEVRRCECDVVLVRRRAGSSRGIPTPGQAAILLDRTSLP